jgi:putative peptidoglycan lipid II flippase
VIAATNIAQAVALTRGVTPPGTAPGLVLAYDGAYLVGAIGSYSLLRHVLDGLQTPVLVRFLVRLLIAAGIAAGVAWAAKQALEVVWVSPTGPAATAGAGKAQAVGVLAVTGLVDVAVLVLLARAMRISEVTSVISLVTGRLRR